MSLPIQKPEFHGWRVVGGAFVLAVLGWGLGFHGMPVYLHTVREARGFALELVSTAVTLHYLVGAMVVANLPRLYARFGLPRITSLGVVLLALGLLGWAYARTPAELLCATLFSGSGWVTMSAAAVNAILSPWFVRDRPKALSTAYNGASIGGLLFTPLLVALIGAFGFPATAAVIGAVAVITVWGLSLTLFSLNPTALGQSPDGARGNPTEGRAQIRDDHARLTGPALWHDRKFITLASAMALGLFAQIGLMAHLFSMIVPALGPGWSGMVMSLGTGAAIVGRTAVGWFLTAKADRRRIAMLSHVIQILGIALLALSAQTAPTLIVAGVLLFGFGIGNATSMPPLIAQAEFAREDTQRVVALIVAIGQGTYAFAPALFGWLRALSEASRFPAVFLVSALVMLLAIVLYQVGRPERAVR